ncbi:hypothetical protein C5E10_05320 [Pseudoclavibacter sp. RFBG4]|uniref:phage portal protein n=1 Tax=Pseudoclavibacter sp. RFBG4 TaxID=2080575 RepID=UPI000CE8C43F|nr:phage portal protein [Pseudoclavibacter sp. RFBG4]PPG35023.1 hypothetical protein C5E10_05320 [Pseudoclavibacter sp. RFBG4]
MTDITPALATELVGELDADLAEAGRLGKIARYLRGKHDKPYMPKGAKKEYEHLADRAVTNWLPLVSETFAKGLFVDGLRLPKATSNAEAWAFWQRNGMDARQTIAHRGALEYGTSYVLVLPGDTAPVIRPLSPLKSAAWYAEDDDEYPEVAISLDGTTRDKKRLLSVYSATERVRFELASGDGAKWVEIERTDHGIGFLDARLIRVLDAAGVGDLIPAAWRGNEPTPKEPA